MTCLVSGQVQEASSEFSNLTNLTFSRILKCKATLLGLNISIPWSLQSQNLNKEDPQHQQVGQPKERIEAKVKAAESSLQVLPMRVKAQGGNYRIDPARILIKFLGMLEKVKETKDKPLESWILSPGQMSHFKLCKMLINSKEGEMTWEIFWI